jgi:hypothetical protein
LIAVSFEQPCCIITLISSVASSKYSKISIIDHKLVPESLPDPLCGGVALGIDVGLEHGGDGYLAIQLVGLLAQVHPGVGWVGKVVPYAILIID